MPISSGANGWPMAHHGFRPNPERTVKIVPKPYRSPSPPRHSYYRYPQSSHSPPPPYYRVDPDDRGCGGGGCGPCGSGRMCADGGPCGPPSGAGGAGPCCCFCGGGALYTTEVAGANAGCFQGGMFGSKNPPYPMGQSNYVLQNTGRHRCWACVIGMIIGLLLLGLILGCILAVDPYLKTQSAIKDYLANNPGARVVGDYIIVPRKTYIDYYKVNGAAVPCQPSYNDTVPTTEVLVYCTDLTTSIEWTYSVLITGPTTEVTTAGVRQAEASLWLMVAACFIAVRGLGAHAEVVRT